MHSGSGDGIHGRAVRAVSPAITRTFVVVSHTHWDREWYQPFEEFRARLVRMMDSLLELLERDPDYQPLRARRTDGAAGRLPRDPAGARASQIERLVREGRLLAGPNYMLPDEFLIGGEAWVRNLMFGIRSARQYGRAMMVGYSPDAFGHIAHLPAILRGFGIDSVLIWRGVGPEATTLGVPLAGAGRLRGAGSALPVRLRHACSAMPEDGEALANVLESVRNMLEPLATTRYVLTSERDRPPAGAHRALRGHQDGERDPRRRDEMVHGNYPMFVAERPARSSARRATTALPLLKGEFRNSKRSNILAGRALDAHLAEAALPALRGPPGPLRRAGVAWAHLLEEGAGSRSP